MEVSEARMKRKKTLQDNIKDHRSKRLISKLKGC